MNRIEGKDGVPRLLVSFYGDDFTGSTDAMECLELNGIPAVLYLEPPSPGRVWSEFPGIRGVGIAGITRSLPTERMEGELRPAFEALRELGAPFVHYKICSTFDSSPTVGSIGRAIDLGWEVFEPPVVPMMVGAPFLRRYVVFGNLFARVADATYRLDRHPTMSRHPVTPMRESDLRVHLAKQTAKRAGLLDVLDLSRDETVVEKRFRELLDAGHEIVLFDTLGESDMLRIGGLVWALRGDRPVFLVGSSGFEYALGLYLRQSGELPSPPPLPRPGRAERMVVMSGSCAPGTAAQIDWALARGFVGLRLDVNRLLEDGTFEAERDATVERALSVLRRGRSVLLYSAKGPDDPAIAAAKDLLSRSGRPATEIGARLGDRQGRVLRRILEDSSVRRVCVTGGDTCGLVSRQLGLFALRMIVPVAPGAPLCRAFSQLPHFDGLEISLKGGQNGSDDYFGRILLGLRPTDSEDELDSTRGEPVP